MISKNLVDRETYIFEGEKTSGFFTPSASLTRRAAGQKKPHPSSPLLRPIITARLQTARSACRRLNGHYTMRYSTFPPTRRFILFLLYHTSTPKSGIFHFFYIAQIYFIFYITYIITIYTWFTLHSSICLFVYYFPKSHCVF